MPDPALTAEPFFWMKNIWLPLSISGTVTVVGWIAPWAYRHGRDFLGRRSAQSLRDKIELVRVRAANPAWAFHVLSYEQARSGTSKSFFVYGSLLLLLGILWKLPLHTAILAQIAGSFFLGIASGSISRISDLSKEIYNSVYNTERTIKELQRRLDRIKHDAPSATKHPG